MGVVLVDVVGVGLGIFMCIVLGCGGLCIGFGWGGGFGSVGGGVVFGVVVV